MKIQWTSEWQVRCPKCDSARSLRDLGGRRTAPAIMTKQTVGWCSQCRKVRLMIIEAIDRAKTTRTLEPEAAETPTKDREAEQEA